jgi:TonB family protein
VAGGIALGLALSLSAQTHAQPPAPPVQEGPIRTGQRISLDLKGVDILDVLKLLSQKSGLNFIAGRNVTGRITIFVNDVDVWDAFELIIGANDFAYERRGEIVTVMMARDYELLYGEKFQARTQTLVQPLRYAKGPPAAAVLNQLKSSIGRVVVDDATNTLILMDVPAKLVEMQGVIKELDRPTKTRVYNLNYADAEKLKEKIQELLSPVGTFTFDARTNTAVASDQEEVLAKVDRIVRAFDTPDGQVLIEAKIVKVDLTNEMDLGIDWQQVFAGIDVRARGNFRVLSDVVGGTATGTALKLLTGQGDTQVIIEALQKITKTDTLSNPRIMVSNNQEAKILVGTKEAVVTTTTTVPATGSTVSAPEIQYVDVGTKLFVTPSIKRNGYIQLKVRPEVSSSKIETFQTNRIPIVTSTEAETNVLIRSGVTLIIGGLIEHKDERTDSRVPVLGDLPVIGAVFRGSTDTNRKTELVLFLTPQIVMPDGSAYADSPPPPVIEEVEPDSGAGTVPPAYRQAVRRHLQERLTARLRQASLPPGSVIVSFTLEREGRLIGDQHITSSEGEAFIQAAREALQQAEPFPPFPQDSQAHEIKFRLAVEYAP